MGDSLKNLFSQGSLTAILIGVIVLFIGIIVLYNTPSQRYKRKCRKNVYSKLSPFDFTAECEMWKEYKKFDYQQYIYDQLRELDVDDLLNTLYDIEAEIWTEFKRLSADKDEKLVQKGRDITKKAIASEAVFIVTCHYEPHNENEREATKSKTIPMKAILNYVEHDYENEDPDVSEESEEGEDK